ncbi:MAG: hypothetical protein RMJ52_02115, partial [Gemmataceae bacterium]|nr:hypothetical protein [Gemmataceae bacterium]
MTRSWTNEGAYSQGQNVGRGWIIAETPSLFREVDPFSGAVVLTVVTGGTAQQVFDEQPNGSYLGRGGILDILVYESTTGQYRLTAPDGTELWFWDFDPAKPAQQQGQFAKLEDPSGNVTEVTSLLADGRIGEVQRSAPAGGSTVTESYLFTYVTGGSNAGLIASITQRRRVDSGPWSTVRKAEYVYYDGVEPHGSAGDLKKVVVKDAADTVLETSYYRYYVAGENNGYEGGLKYVFRPSSYARLAANVANPETASDAQIAPYADHYFEYDDQFRVTKEVAAGAGDDESGGRGTFTFTYTINELGMATMPGGTGGPAGSGDPNVWLVKTVETLPDGNQHIVYTNANRQAMLKVFQETASSQQWRTYYRYDASGRLILMGNPSAVTGYDETSPDLLVNQWGNYQYLSDTAGLVTTWTYGTVTTASETMPGDAAGRLKQVAVQRGELGTAIPQQDVTYIKRTVGASALFFAATVTAYRHDDGTGATTTSFAYTWQGTTAQPASVTVTLPAVPTAQNGSGTATTLTTVFDTFGRPIWQKDGSGFLTYREYDPATGAVVKEIRDVDTTQTATFSYLPSGWTTPAGGGLHLITTYEVDALGRVTKVVHPNGRVDCLTYNDVSKEVRVYSGWDTGTNTPTLPTQVVRADWANGYVETLTMSATPAVQGGRPTRTEAISSLHTLSRSYTNAGGQVTHADAYFNLSGLSYTTSPNLGTANTHFYRTEYGYDDAGRLDRTLSPSGTIYRTVWDGLGRAMSQWVGLDDTPTSGEWSPSNTAGTDLVKINEYQYDNGGVGDGNLTQVTQFPGGSAAPRVTQTWYDWRNRPVAVKAGVEVSESDSVNRPFSYVEYDNLGQVTVREVYDGDGVSVVDADGDGIPDRPAAALLRARSVT